ncbi:hypothetical protein FACS189493_7800 [Spirochaetia bacterium]|nr:hypothetical protein FACS189493_7800 [Spirochaetia bacterium]
MRYFNQKPIELLAPAGNFAVFQKIINTNCDAVYFGGKRFNMRLHRKGYNFSNEELREAVQIAHDNRKRVYITVNNMYTQGDLPELREFLVFLAEAGPDALIVQDFSVPALVRQLQLPLALHSSVMMNVHNLATIKRLEELGVSRVVVSRELPLSYVKSVSFQSKVEFEYFVHGDMCVAHGGQCLYSGILFGSSSNQGRCRKPCRWNFGIEYDRRSYPAEFLLAVKDMYLYEHIPELIHHNIGAFKIEGRMREPEFLEGLVNAYGDAIDRYLADPLAYDPKTGADYLYENRKRDFSTAYAFGKPGLANINRRGEGTGTFYSTGKPFSVAAEEPELTTERIGAIRDYLAGHDRGNTRKPELACKVQNLAQARYCIKQGVDHVYLSGEAFRPDKPFLAAAIKELIDNKGNSKLYLCQSRMMFDLDMEEYQAALGIIRGLDGLVVTSFGGIMDRGLPCIGDYALNIQNSVAWELYRAEGLARFTISAETKLPDTAALLEAAGEWAELIVFGSPTVMYLEHDLYENVRQAGTGTDGTELLYLIDEKGFRHPVYRDRRGRNHILLYKDLFYLPFLRELYRAGLSRFRLEIAHLSQEKFEQGVAVFREALGNLEKAAELAQGYEPPRGGFTPGPWTFLGETNE